MSRELSRDEWRAFVMEGTRTGKLATTRTDARELVKVVAKAEIAD